MPDKTYCYPNTNTLVNKLNIRNEKELLADKVIAVVITFFTAKKVPKSAIWM